MTSDCKTQNYARTHTHTHTHSCARIHTHACGRNCGKTAARSDADDEQQQKGHNFPDIHMHKNAAEINVVAVPRWRATAKRTQIHNHKHAHANTPPRCSEKDVLKKCTCFTRTKRGAHSFGLKADTLFFKEHQGLNRWKIKNNAEIPKSLEFFKN